MPRGRPALGDEWYQDQIIAAMPDLNRVGAIVKTGQIWDRKLVHFSYPMICKHFKIVMDTMVEQKKAIKIKRGTWKILKPNERSQ